MDVRVCSLCLCACVSIDRIIPVPGRRLAGNVGRAISYFPGFSRSHNSQAAFSSAYHSAPKRLVSGPSRN